MKRLFSSALLITLAVVGPVYAQATSSQSSDRLLTDQERATIKEMEMLMAKVRVPFPKSNVPDEVKSICVNGRKALAVRYGAYGSIMWDVTPQGATLLC